MKGELRIQAQSTTIKIKITSEFSPETPAYPYINFKVIDIVQVNNGKEQTEYNNGDTGVVVL